MSSIVIDLSLVNKTINKNYIFKDSLFDLHSNTKRNDLRVAVDYQAVQNGIQNLFLFKQGERILLPEFGNSLYKYLYEPINDLTAEKIRNEISFMFEKWEPRVQILGISVQGVIDEQMYKIVIAYIVPAISKQNKLEFSTAIGARR